MDTFSADTVYEGQRLRTVRLRAAVALGAAAAVAAFGAGYVLAEALDDTVPATVPEARASVGHSFGSALTESLALKQRLAVKATPMDIRDKRVE